MRASRVTLIGAALLGGLAIGMAAWLPLNSPVPLSDADSPATIAVFAAEGLVWLLAAVVTLARQPANRVWKLTLAYLLGSWLVWSLEFVPSPVVQGLAVTLSPMGPVSALRETSVVIAAGIGSLLLHEPFGRWRIVAASFCAIGIIAINLPLG